MSFELTSKAGSISVVDGHILKATVHADGNNYVEAQLDLNTCIGNTEGNFVWGEQDFLKTAQDVSLSFVGNNQPMLSAELRTTPGRFNPATINLAERIMNQSGKLVYVNQEMIAPPFISPPVQNTVTV